MPIRQHSSSLIVVALLLTALLSASAQSINPDSGRLVARDIPHFRRAVDQAADKAYLSDPSAFGRASRVSIVLTPQQESGTRGTVGALTGLAVGAIAGYAIAARNANHCHGGEACQRPYFEIIAYPVALGALGTAIGWLVGSHWPEH